MQTVNLNQGQKAAADAFLEFLFGEDKEFRIAGPAGVGKTFLMKHIINKTMQQYEDTCKMIGQAVRYTSIHMTATTNKAAEVLSTTIGLPCSTIHSFMHLRVQNDFNTGRSSLKRTNKWHVHENEIIFIDEASMIDTDLYRVIHEGTNNCKIVYVGDHNQLAPVFEPISPVYKNPKSLYKLTEQMRNSGQPALMAVCQQLRETVETGVFKPIQIVPGVIDLMDDDAMMAELTTTFQNQTTESRILAYTNKRVNEYNDWVRAMRNLPDHFMTGELLVNNSAAEIKSDKMLSVEEEIEILRNCGSEKVKVFTDKSGEPTYLDVDRLDINSKYLGVCHDIPVPTNKAHYAELLKYFSSIKNWERYYYLQNKFPDFRPRDAATVHKAQGSTYETVFIDLGNISTVRKAEEVSRMLYVAFSRARSRVFLYGDLVSKYGGLMK